MADRLRNYGITTSGQGLNLLWKDDAGCVRGDDAGNKFLPKPRALLFGVVDDFFSLFRLEGLGICGNPARC